MREGRCISKIGYYRDIVTKVVFLPFPSDTDAKLKQMSQSIGTSDRASRYSDSQ